MDQSSFSVFTPSSLPFLKISRYYHHHHHHHHHQGIDFCRNDYAVSEGFAGSYNGDDVDDDDEFEFRSPVSEWDGEPSSPSLMRLSPTTSHLLIPSRKPTSFFKPPLPPVLSLPVSKPYPIPIANLSKKEDSSPNFKKSHSANTLEDIGPSHEEVKALQEKLSKVKKFKLKDLLRRNGQDKQPRSPIPHSWPGWQGSIYSTSSPFDSGKKRMNETALGIMEIKASPSFLHPTAPILKSSFASPSRKAMSATSSPSRQEVFCNSKPKHKKKTSLPYRQGFLGCLRFPMQNSL